MLDIISKNCSEPKYGATKAVVCSIKSSFTFKHNSINVFAFISLLVFLILCLGQFIMGNCYKYSLLFITDSEIRFTVDLIWRLPPTAHTCMLGPLNGNLHILDQLVVCFIRCYCRLTSSDNAIVSFIARLAMSNKQIYLRSDILYIKWKYGADITKTDIHECIGFVHQKCQHNAELVSMICMLNELIDARCGFKVVPNLGNNEIIEYNISISTISLC